MPTRSGLNPKRLFRQIHYWLSLAIFLPCGVIFTAGIFLMLKKDVSWIQPATQKGVVMRVAPEVSYSEMMAVARSVPEAEVRDWSDIARLDIQPAKGTAKLTSETGWELQIDTSSGDLLSSAYRRSDLIESLHDGSFFADWVKLYIFLPTGVILIIMWATGIYLFLLPRLAKRAKAQRAGRG